MRLLWWALALLLLVADTSGFSLRVTNFTEVKPDSAGAKGVGLWLPTMLFEGSSESADEGIEAAPRLPERAGTRCRRVRVAEERAELRVHFRLPKLVQVPQELQHVGPAAPLQRQWRPVVPEVLPERVPVPPLLVLIPT